MFKSTIAAAAAVAFAPAAALAVLMLTSKHAGWTGDNYTGTTDLHVG